MEGAIPAIILYCSKHEAIFYTWENYIKILEVACSFPPLDICTLVGHKTNTTQLKLRSFRPLRFFVPLAVGLTLGYVEWHEADEGQYCP